jgi:hypothetical protein
MMRVKRVFAASLLFVLTVIATLQSVNLVQGLLWSSPILVDQYQSMDKLPSALQSSNGTLWLAWQSDRYAGSTGYNDILYKTRTNGQWSGDTRLTSVGRNADAALAQLANGTIFLFWAAKLSTNYQIFYERFTNDAWSPSTQVTFATVNDSLPTAATSPDGTLWLVWSRDNLTTLCPSCPAYRQLFYKTLKGNVWSQEAQLTSDNNWNWYPSIMVGKDSLVRLAYSKTPAGTDANQIYYRTNSGASWSSESQIVSSSTSDERASLAQDRNGTLWIFWGRKIVVSSLLFYYALYNKYSYDSGRTWSSDFQMTNTANTVDSKEPAAVQSSAVDRAIWVFYNSNLNVYWNTYALMSQQVYPVHDVDVSSVTASQGQGSTWTITVRVANPGDYTETVSVTMTMYDSTSYVFGPLSGSVVPGGSVNIVFVWDTTGFPTGSYGARASVAPVPGETLPNQADNTLQVGGLVQVVTVVPPTGPVGGHAPYHV